MASHTTGPQPDQVPVDAVGGLEIGFVVPEIYNASAVLFDNLARRWRRRRVSRAGSSGCCA